MREYELRRGHWKHIDGEQLLHLIQDVFGDGVEDGEWYVARNFGAIEELRAKQVGKTSVIIDTKMNADVPPEEQQRTMRAWNDFLELVTGYNAKERSKRVKKAIEKETADAEA